VSNLTPEACRAARAILQWTVRDLAEKAGIAFSTVHLVEKGANVREESKEKIVTALTAAGICLVSEGGTGAFLLARNELE